MHRMHHTHGFVLKSSPYGEANRIVTIFTRELGLIKASAQSVRHVHSKLRPGLLDFAYSRITVVRGKSVWRITSVLPESNIWTALSNHTEVRLMFGRVFSLLLRLLHGEEKNELLFEHLESAYTFCRECRNPEKLLPDMEYVLVLRVLHTLGYVGASPSISDLVHSPYWSEGVVERMGAVKHEALKEINRSLHESQL